MFVVDEGLEDWLSAHEHRAAHVLGWSGVAAAPFELLGPVELPRDGSFGEPAGDAALREAVARAEGVPAEEVVLASGAGEADALATLLLARGGRAVVESPTYPPIADVARLVASEVVRLPRRGEDAFALDVDAACAAVRPGTALVALTSPHNPSGDVVAAEDLRRLAEACGRVGAWLLVDEIFRRLQEAPGPSARALHPRILATGSLTKAEGLPGLRFGWLLAPPEVAQGALALKLATTGPLPRVAQAWAAAAFAARPRLLERALGFRRANLARMRRDLEKRGGWRAPAAGVATTVQVAGDDEAFAKRALAERDVLVVPGSYLGAPGFVRVGYGIEPSAFTAGWERLAPYFTGP